MKVILRQTVPKVGKEGTVVSVADGFARNYLFPRGLAIVAEKNQVKALDRQLAKLAEKSAGQKTAAEGLRDQIHGKTLRIEGKVGKDSGKLFGAVTSQDVVDEIKKQLGIIVEKKQVALIEPIKRLGNHEVELDLHREVDAKIIVNVFDPAAPEEQPEAEPEAEAEVMAEAEVEAEEPEPEAVEA